MTELTTMRKLKWAKRKKTIEEKARKTAQSASDWMKENKETLAIVVPGLAVGVRGASRVVSSAIRKNTVKHEERSRQTRFYDHSLGCYWYTKRPLRKDELLSVKRRKNSGESYGDIFKSMKLLK